MGGSIHISGTGSSVVDTVFVCRSKGSVSRLWLPETSKGVAALVLDDLARLREGGLKPTQGDISCIIYGHLVRLTIWKLRKTWNKSGHTLERLRTVADELNRLGGLDTIKNHLGDAISNAPPMRFSIQEEKETYMMESDEISF